MTTNEPLSPAEEQLAAYERDPDLQHIYYTMKVEPAIDELRASASQGLMDGISLLAKWSLDYPSSMTRVLRAIAKDPEVALELAPVVLGCEAATWPGPDGADDILATAFPQLTGPYRNAAANRRGVREILKIPEGVGYEPVSEPDPSWLWPQETPLPSVHTIEGAQARLNRFGVGAGPVNGVWSDLTQRALLHWQISMGLNPTGELDEDTTRWLTYESGDLPYW